MATGRRSSGWNDFFGVVKKQHSEYYQRLKSDRQSLMKALDALLEQSSSTGLVDKMAMHAIMLNLNCCDMAILAAHKKEPLEGFRDILIDNESS